MVTIMNQEKNHSEIEYRVHDFFEDFDFVKRCIYSCKWPIQVREPISNLICQFLMLHVNDVRCLDYVDELQKMRRRKTDEIYERVNREYEELIKSGKWKPNTSQ